MKINLKRIIDVVINVAIDVVKGIIDVVINLNCNK